MRFTPERAEDIIGKLHEHYFQRLSRFAEEQGLTFCKPSYLLRDCVYRACGQYNTNDHVCLYSLPYACLVGETYGETVAHELCHAYIESLIGAGYPSHGPRFVDIFRFVCGFEAIVDYKKIAYHDYNITAAEEIAKHLKATRQRPANDVSMSLSARSLADLRKRIN